MMMVIWRAMGKLLRVLAVYGLILVLLEGLSCLALGAIALRGGQTSTYFRALLPHPAISRHVAEMIPESFLLLRYERPITYEGKVHGEFEWHPLLGYYRPILPDGTLRVRPAFSPNELVVYLLGGSTVEGGGISTHLQAYLQAQLKDRYEVRVINEGVGGYMSTQEMVLLQTKILPFGNPHYVIAVDGYNDWLATVYNFLNDSKEKAGVTEEIWPQAELSWFYYWFDEWSGRKAINTVPGAFAQLVGVTSRQILPHTYTGWLLNHIRNWVNIVLLSKFGVDTVHLYSGWARVGFERATPLPPERAQLHALNARMMAEACRARGARFFWALQPGLPYRGEAMTPEERQFYIARPMVYWQSLERYYQDVRGIVERDADFWKSRFLDLSTPPLKVKELVFVDTAHLSMAGAQWVAQSLAASILKDLASRGGARPQGTMPGIRSRFIEEPHAVGNATTRGETGDGRDGGAADDGDDART